MNNERNEGLPWPGDIDPDAESTRIADVVTTVDAALDSIHGVIRERGAEFAAGVDTLVSAIKQELLK